MFDKKKLVEIIVLILLINSAIFLSGCTEDKPKSQIDTETKTGEKYSEELKEAELQYNEITTKAETLSSMGYDISEIIPLIEDFNNACENYDLDLMDIKIDEINDKFELIPTPTRYFDHSLRILTYNTFFLPWIANHNPEDINYYFASNQAFQIIKTDADIVVLNEVFDEECRQRLIDILQTVYPYYVSKIDHTNEEDSGLMLFSKYPFTTQDNRINVATGWEGETPVFPFKTETEIDISSTNKGIPYDISFAEYPSESCINPDCMAAKGIGFARIEVPVSEKDNRIVNIGFTHMQASYANPPSSDTEGPVKRNMQMNIIWEFFKKIFENSNNPNRFNWVLGNEEFYLLGDLNIDGNLNNHNGVALLGQEKEWDYHFNRPGSPFYDYLKDGWAYGTSELDIGQTSGEGFPYFPKDGYGERLDYILHNTPIINDKKIVLQHIRYAIELFDASYSPLSDHLGVYADFNLEADHCSPLTAKVVNPETDTVNQGTITYKGSMQWYRIDTPGVYSIDAQPDFSRYKINYDVYEATDLSWPLASYYNEITDWGTKFTIPSAPFYIRVYSSDRTFTGGYKLYIHRHNGENEHDAISLIPGIPVSETYPSQIPLNNDNIMWFEFHNDVADGGHFIYPDFAVVLKEPELANFIMTLVDSNLQTIHYSSDISYRDRRFPGYNKIIEVHGDAFKLPKGKYYIKVQPVNFNPADETITIQWKTTLTKFIPIQLQCIEPTDWAVWEEDEMFYFYSFDNGNIQGNLHIADMEEDYPAKGLTGIIPSVKFVDNFVLGLWEDDDDDPPDDYFEEIRLEVINYDEVDLMYGAINPVNKGSQPFDEEILLMVQEYITDTTGWYLLTFRITHHMTPKYKDRSS